MSDLQINLIVIGIVIIGGVVFYNWMQQRRYQRNTEKAFKNKYEDVLLEAEKTTEVERVEPQLNTEVERVELQLNKEVTGDFRVEPSIKEKEIVESDSKPEQKHLNTTNESARPVKVYSNGVVDYVVSIQSETPVTVSDLAEILQRKVGFGKPVRWFGQKNAGAFWEEITIESDPESDYTGLRACLQLADRSGPVSEVSLSEFRDMVQNFAELINAVADTPDIGEAYSQAVLLDQFCAEVDVMIGINVISKDGGAFTGTKIRALAEASGFKLDGGGVFNFREGNDDAKFTLNNYESTPFLPDNIRTLTTNGVTFLFDVPRIKNGERVFDQMTHLSRIFATTLGGTMVDDNQVPLSDSGIDRIKHKLNGIQAVMKSRDFPAGGEIALRLFA
jgi:FtsZ-interacting cell division protein ZipA